MEGDLAGRAEPAKESEAEWPWMWEDNTVCMFGDYVAVNILNFMVFHKENHASSCWSAMQTNVGVLVGQFVLQTKYLLCSASENGENNEGLE